MPAPVQRSNKSITITVVLTSNVIINQSSFNIPLNELANSKFKTFWRDHQCISATVQARRELKDPNSSEMSSCIKFFYQVLQTISSNVFSRCNLDIDLDKFKFYKINLYSKL